MMTFILWRFGDQLRFVLMWEWLIEKPVCLPLPQIAHTLDILAPP